MFFIHISNLKRCGLILFIRCLPSRVVCVSRGAVHVLTGRETIQYADGTDPNARLGRFAACNHIIAHQTKLTPTPRSCDIFR